MTIIGLSGAIGSGKSHTQLKVALEHCERKEKQLVCNFPVDVRAIYKYAELKKMRWIQRLCMRGSVIQIQSPDKLESLLIPESVICLDEAGVFLNSRDFARTSRTLLADLAQSRKDGCDLIYAAQFDEQVDKQMRLLTQYWVHCDGMSVYDKKLKRPRLIWKRAFWFKAPEYNFWQADPKARSSYLITRFKFAFNTEEGFLDKADYRLFKCFNSFDRLDSSKGFTHIKTLQRCDLPADYYYGVPAWDASAFPSAPKPDIPLSDRTDLIREALSISRMKGVRAPYFKSQTDSQIRAFIASNR